MFVAAAVFTFIHGILQSLKNMLLLICCMSELLIFNPQWSVYSSFCSLSVCITVKILLPNTATHKTNHDSALKDYDLNIRDLERDTKQLSEQPPGNAVTLCTCCNFCV